MTSVTSTCNKICGIPESYNMKKWLKFETVLEKDLVLRGNGRQNLVVYYSLQLSYAGIFCELEYILCFIASDIDRDWKRLIRR